MEGALGLLEEAAAKRGQDRWLLGQQLTQADITVACILTFLAESLDVGKAGPRYPALAGFVAQCEALPEFRSTHAPWFAAKVEA
jgi:glutathione S-transferase